MSAPPMLARLSRQQIIAELKLAEEWNDYQGTMADACDMPESARLHDARIKEFKAMRGALTRTAEDQAPSRLEEAARAAHRAAQPVYRSDYDEVPMTDTWETTTEDVREGWRKIAKAALRQALNP
jgi:hypothetical protein